MHGCEQLGIVGEGAEKGRMAGRSHRNVPGDEARGSNNQACARYLGQTSVAELAETIRECDQRDRPIAFDPVRQQTLHVGTLN